MAQFDLQSNSIDTQLIKKWEYLVNNNQEFDESTPLSNPEIESICQVLKEEDKTRPLGIARGEFSIPDDFKEPLPDDIVDLFFSIAFSV